jgi:four helix bundle protein
METIRTFRDLLVWQKGMQLVTRVYEVSRELPKEELYGLTSQMRRSAISIPSNIAEGHGRSSTKEYVHFLEVAVGSLFELDTQLEIARNLGYYESAEIFAELHEMCQRTRTHDDKLDPQTESQLNPLPLCISAALPLSHAI